MNKQQTIPEADLKAINDSFKETERAQLISKDSRGDLKEAKIDSINPVTSVISDFRGRTLKHQKSLVPENGSQMVIGVRGQAFDSIPHEQRKLVLWFESDFE